MKVLCLNGSVRELPALPYSKKKGCYFTETNPKLSTWFVYSDRVHLRVGKSFTERSHKILIAEIGRETTFILDPYNEFYLPINIWTGEPL